MASETGDAHESQPGGQVQPTGAAGSTPQSDPSQQGFWSSLIKNARDVVIVIGAFAFITGMAIPFALHYPTAHGATSVLSVVVPAISTIAAAAFGISAGATAGAATGNAAAQKAQNETQQKRQQAKDAQQKLDTLRTHLGSVVDQLNRLPSPAGSRDFVVSSEHADALSQLAEPIRVPASSLDSVRDSVGQLQQSLKRLAE